MEETVRSGGVVKKKSSSGCLIIRKKDDRAGGVQRGGIGSLKKNKKKRPRVIVNDSESGDELPEPYKRKAQEISGNSPITYRSGAEGNGNTESDKKRSRLDLFEFDEYDEFDERAVRNEYRDGRLAVTQGMGSSREFRSGSSGEMIVAKRKFDSSRNALGSRTKGFDCSAKTKTDEEEDDVDLPISMLKLKYQKTSNEAIRLQGKNGVLKVMVNKKKMDLSHKKNDCRDFDSRKGSTSEDLIMKKLQVQPHSDSEHPEKQHLSVQREKSKMKSRKILMSNNTGASDSETDGTGTSPKVILSALPAGNSLKRVKKEENKLSTVNPVSPTNKEGKTKRGASTEKQKLREKIRGVLTDAGWTIDYRPRRNRDYLDAVYISPCGTAYWSIVKAYDAFQKQLEEDSGGNKSAGVSAPFSPLLEDINKLTRQTRKKIEREMKKKRKDNGTSRDNKKTSGKESAEGSDSDQHDERLSSYIKKSGKLLKGKFHARHQKNQYGTSENISVSKDGKHDQDIIGKFSVAPTGKLIQGRKSKIIGRCTLLVRSSDKGQNSEIDGYVPYSGKRTLLAWMIDSGTAKLSEKVQYMNRRKTHVKLEGWITRDGIHCGCCSKILTVSKFELHAGSKLRQPFQNIVLESGVSLLQCLIDAWNRQEESERQDFCTVDTDGDDPDDDTCGICGDGGDLICCDSCPSTFHQSCLGIMMLPPGDWHCPSCICKFCGIGDESPTEDDMDVNELHLCILCEKKYHKLCRQELEANNVLPVKNKISSTSFCGQTCQELYDRLRKIVGVKHELEAGFSWSLIQRTNLDSDTSHCEFPQRVEGNSKMAVALSIMDECFLPIVDRRSEINIIHNVLYNCGSNFSRINYRGFYTAILERGDEIISAASIRIHGTQLAEMPFIGTRHIYRRQGMCRRLLSAIEMVLSTLKVEKLIIPAISEHIHTWTVVFGFNQLEESHKREMKSMNMLVFPGVDMLQKQLVKQGASEGLRAVDFRSPSKSDTVSCAKRDANECHDTGLQNANEIHAKVESGCLGSPASAAQSHDSTMIDGQDYSPSTIKSSNKVTESIKSEVENKLGESSTNLGQSAAGENVITLDMQDAVVDLLPTKDDVLATSEISDSAPTEVDGKAICVDSVHCSSLDLAINGDRKQTSQSASGKPIEQPSSDPNLPSTIDGENKPNMASEKTTDTEGVDSAKIIPCEGKNDLASSNERKNVEESCVEPSKTSSQDMAEKDESS
ncbi:PREDICTED: increased DNA methylation 1-like [Ipomoea nil]|uniref:increased DNA methylation 1-like n=1 Tax=Ipomoea nil TaxID=35883 RepID=UPI0009008A00|nr:PREDICTED: increased DNA methylation 1-like [Ipomoea nil]